MPAMAGAALAKANTKTKTKLFIAFKIFPFVIEVVLPNRTSELFKPKLKRINAQGSMYE
jgi:hypothetical protein